MDGWMDGWMDGRTDGGMDGWKDVGFGFAAALDFAHTVLDIPGYSTFPVTCLINSVLHATLKP